MTDFPLPLRFGLVGTGYAAKLRAEALTADDRAHLVAVAGHDLCRTQVFSQAYGAKVHHSWRSLVQDPCIDVVVIATINREHGAIAQAALSAGKHVVVEYPLALDVVAAAQLVELAKVTQRLLHVEHIELLGGLHQILKANLEAIGQPFYACYITATPQHPAPQKWTYDTATFGFPLIGALSRLHRLIDLFGRVERVACEARFWPQGDRPGAYTACVCTAHLRFKQGVVADVTYAKGETIWQANRSMEVHGSQGALVFQGDRGCLITALEQQELTVPTRQGLFVKDTALVLDHLTQGHPLYVQPTESLYTLQVAAAAQQAAETGRVITIPNSDIS